MISMAYDHHCETFYFVWRNTRCAFAGFGPHRRRKRNERRSRRHETHEAATAAVFERSSAHSCAKDQLSHWNRWRAQTSARNKRSKAAKSPTNPWSKSVRSPSGLAYPDSSVDWLCISQIQHRARELGGLASEGRDDKSHAFVWPRNIRRIQRKIAPHSRAQTSMQSKQR